MLILIAACRSVVSCVCITFHIKRGKSLLIIASHRKKIEKEGNENKEKRGVILVLARREGALFYLLSVLLEGWRLFYRCCFFTLHAHGNFFYSSICALKEVHYPLHTERLYTNCKVYVFKSHLFLLIFLITGVCFSCRSSMHFFFLPLAYTLVFLLPLLLATFYLSYTSSSELFSLVLLCTLISFSPPLPPSSFLSYPLFHIPSTRPLYHR